MRTQLLSLVVTASIGGLSLPDFVPHANAAPPPKSGAFDLLTVRQTLFFGEPNSLCNIGLDPAATGLLLRDPRGIRIASVNEAPPTLIFGNNPDNLCAISIDPIGRLPGLLLRDPRGIRIASVMEAPPTLIFGNDPDNVCAISIDPTGQLPGLLLRDPSGIRILSSQAAGDRIGDLPAGERLIFGPTDDCTIQIDPRMPGLLLRDPRGIRIASVNEAPPTLIFGNDPDNICFISIDPTGKLPGLLLSDPKGIRIVGGKDADGKEAPPTLIFGNNPDNLCVIAVRESPTLGGHGIVMSDPRGVGVESPVLSVDGAVVADQFVTRSSRDLKKNIRPIENALDKISRLQGVTFEWNGRADGATDIGLIAEDVNEVLPELVVKGPSGHSALKYPNLVAVTVEGMKEQQRQIGTLREENAALKDTLTGLQAQMTRMAARLDQLGRANSP